MPIMQKLPFTVRCPNCDWRMTESGDAIDIPPECLICGHPELKIDHNSSDKYPDYLLPKNVQSSGWIEYVKKLFKF